MRILSLLAAACAFSAFASAGLIVDTPFGPNVISFGDGGASTCSTGPTTATDAGFSISTDGAACFPWSGGWSFDDNGQWNALPVLADNSGTTTITINLGNSYAAVWGFIDYGLSCGDAFSDPCVTYGNDPTITALDQNMNVIETVDLGLGGYILGSNDEFDYEAGRTLGFSDSTADIAYLQLGGDNIAITNISLSGPAPEPATLLLSGVALAAMGALMRGKGARAGVEHGSTRHTERGRHILP